jgi:hypothetical protein
MPSLLSLLLIQAFTSAARAQVPVDSLPPAPAPSGAQVAEQGAATMEERPGGDLGYGLAVGDPGGFVAKYWLGDWAGIQASLGAGVVGSADGISGEIVSTVDYLVHLRPLEVDADEYSVPFHVGAGMSMGALFADDAAIPMIGPRVVFGLSVLIKDLPVDLFVETAPTLHVYEHLGFSINNQIGVRYYP